MPVFKHEVKKLSEVVNASHATGSFTRGNNVSIHKLPDESNVFVFMIGVDVDYLPTLQLKLKEGRVFTEDDVKGSKKILVNEALVKRFHLEDSIGIALGGRIGFLEHPTIIGVLRNFHHSNLRQEIAPLMLIPDETLNQSFLVVRLAPGQIMSGLEAVSAVWKKINPNAPFDYFFLDEDIQKQYNSEMRWSGIITLATGMAIFLSILGLTGLALYSAEQRKKEIGIRKVLGATLGQLVGLLSRDYVWLIAIAFAVAAPLAYYTMSHYWLNNFAYAVTVDAGLYLIAFGLVCLIAGVAVGSQTLRAARQNPVDTLKEE
jgi:putative ABC transport system permease protein